MIRYKHFFDLGYFILYEDQGTEALFLREDEEESKIKPKYRTRKYPWTEMRKG